MKSPGTRIVIEARLSEAKSALFQEAVWRRMGNLHDARWRDMLDPATSLGSWVRAYYRDLAASADADDPISLLAQAARADLFEP